MTPILPNIKQPWEQRFDESVPAYLAFVTYRDLRSERSIDAAYRRSRRQQSGNKRASGQFTEWSQKFDWKMRAEAYDAYIERKVREEAEARTVDTYERDLSAYFDRQKKLSAAAGNAAIALLTKANEALRNLDTAKMKPGELASLFRAAAAVAGAASDAEAIALGVDDLLKERANAVGAGR
jgi:hypothetical protein